MKGSGLRLLGVELVLQLHEFARRFDLVGNLLPLREETLALLEGQTLRVAAGDRVLLLLTAKNAGGMTVRTINEFNPIHANQICIGTVQRATVTKNLACFRNPLD